MTMSSEFSANLIFAWAWVLTGIIAGFVLGLKFHLDDWLGGYISLRRRLLRLAHIALFGMAIINLMFYFTVSHYLLSGTVISLASWGFILGGVTMPLCCFLMAADIRTRVLFVIPVFILLLSGSLTLAELLNQ